MNVASGKVWYILLSAAGAISTASAADTYRQTFLDIFKTNSYGDVVTELEHGQDFDRKLTGEFVHEEIPGDEDETYPAHKNTYNRPKPHNIPQMKCYTCPFQSHRIKYGDYCTNTFDDCECDFGYQKHHGYCKFCNFECPNFSYARPDKGCIESFDDCVCRGGYYKYGYDCVLKPTPYPTRKPGTQRPTPYPTRKPTPYPTMRSSPPTTPSPTNKPCYWCPHNSHLKQHGYCKNTFDDCECDYGYKRWRGDTCKFCNYQCPQNSVPRSDIGCLSSFDDCECKPGFEEHLYGCLLERTPYPTMKPTPYPVKKRCYPCPHNSHPNPHGHCTGTFHDCICDRGHFMYNGVCIFCGDECPSGHVPYEENIEEVPQDTTQAVP